MASVSKSSPPGFGDMPVEDVVAALFEVVTEVKSTLDTSNALVMETRAAAAEARASVAEVRASVAELRTTLANMTTELVEQRDVLNTIIDAMADLRTDFVEHVHESIVVEEDDDE